jgi:hypothetical protein
MGRGHFTSGTGGRKRWSVPPRSHGKRNGGEPPSGSAIVKVFLLLVALVGGFLVWLHATGRG